MTNTEREIARTSLDEIRLEIAGINTKVPIFNGEKINYIYFDNAASTPALITVLKTINDFMPWYSSIHRGSGFKSQISTSAYDDARQYVLKFFGGNSNDHTVVFGKNTTEAINKLSYRLELTKDDVVLVGMMEHHSNDLPWRRAATVKRIHVLQNGAIDEDHYEKLLEENYEKVKLVAISGGSNVTGHIPDIYSMAARAHDHGAMILVDCAQLAPHRRVDIGDLSDQRHLDFICISAHKMYAPFGTGALIGRKDIFLVGEPEICGGGTIKVVTEDEVIWADTPDRDEAGSPNVVGVVALATALAVLNEIGMDKIAAHETELTSYSLAKLKKIPKVRIYGDSNPKTANNRLGVIPFNIEGIPHELTAAILSAEWGIGVRSGCFCAHPYVTKLLGIGSAGINKFSKEMAEGNRKEIPGLVRISFGVYNTKQEIDRLEEAVINIASGRIKGKYNQDRTSGEFHLDGWEPDFNRFFNRPY